jgi:flagellar secretion chaperone FliS
MAEKARADFFATRLKVSKPAPLRKALGHERPLYTAVTDTRPEIAMVRQQALSQYKMINITSAVEGASPHRLVQMLMQGFIQRLAEAKGAIARGNIAERGVALGKALDILGGLQGSLNNDVPSALPAQLEELYGYMQRRLLQANLKGDVEIVDEVAGLMRTIKEGWDGIAELK